MLTSLIQPRTVWLVSWVLAGGAVLLEALLGGAVPLLAVAALYFGLGAGVELTLFIQGRRTGARPVPQPLLRASENDDLVAGLRALGLPAREASDLAAGVPDGISVEERMAMALKRHGEEAK